MKNTIPVINPDFIVSRNEEKFIVCPVGEETVMMNKDNGDYIGINNVGSDIWEKMKEPVSVKDIIQSLIVTYKVDPAQCEKETLEYLQDMLKEGVLVINE